MMTIEKISMLPCILKVTYTYQAALGRLSHTHVKNLHDNLVPFAAMVITALALLVTPDFQYLNHKEVRCSFLQSTGTITCSKGGVLGYQYNRRLSATSFSTALYVYKFIRKDTHRA
jgi:protein-S-isoprenylcysteine O-methyltransferase Ste14